MVNAKHQTGAKQEVTKMKQTRPIKAYSIFCMKDIREMIKEIRTAEEKTGIKNYHKVFYCDINEKKYDTVEGYVQLGNMRVSE